LERVDSPLSLWERVRVREQIMQKNPSLSPALSRRERE
jgi:hypothetical protein